MVTRLRIAGMVSPRCAQAVFTSLTPVEGITSADVWIGGAEVEHDGRATIPLLRSAIAVAGYDVIDAVERRHNLKVL
jgi:copper chaperone CopZ